MRLAFVVQRYGKEVIGGAELLARELAERLAKRHQLEVLTTCAKDHFSWANHFPKGTHTESGVRVRRFPVTKQRNWTRFGYWSQLLFAINRKAPLPVWLGEKWVVSQGPFAPKLVGHLQTRSKNFDLLVFFTYLYYPTVLGLRSAPAKSILIPTAHDEPAIRLKVFNDVFQLPRHLIFLTDEEKDLVHSLFENMQIPHQTIGMGVTLKEPSKENDGYLFYAGRIESGKNCAMMFDYCKRAGISLKVTGPTRIQVPDHVEYLGQVSELKKESLLERSRAVIVPSAMESLSIAALEAWSHGKPVIAWDRSRVLAGQISRSGGGYLFGNFDQFLDVTRDIDAQRGLRGWEFVKEHYDWNSILPRYEEVFESVAHEALRAVEPD